jgi:acetyl esterase
MTERKYDPEFAPLLAMLPTVSDLGDLAKIREFRENMQALFTSSDRADVTKEDRSVPGPEGAPDVAVRIYRPADAGTETLPCVFEIHGGGFIIGSIAMMEDWCQAISAELRAVVVSVEYRLAPENPFPAGLEDCYAALRWTAKNADSLQVDRRRIAVAGQSAGGGLAAATALLCRDRGGPSLCFQLLEIPELDDRLETPSMQQFDDTPMWNRPNAVASWQHYLGASHAGETSAYAAPSRCKDLGGLPPAYVSVMEFDPLRDEGVLYALALMQAGVATELHAFPGTFHGSALFRDAAVSRRSAAEAQDALRRALAG